MLLPRRADSVNYFLLGSAAIICIFHLAVIDVAGGREEDERDRNTFHFVPQLSGGKKKKKRFADGMWLRGGGFHLG